MYNCKNRVHVSSVTLISLYCRVFSWEDGYLAYPKSTEPVKNIPDDIYFEGMNEIFSSASEMNIGDDGVMEYQIGRAVADMSCHQYAMGEGYYLVLFP